jgi:hypothetical protein
MVLRHLVRMLRNRTGARLQVDDELDSSSRGYSWKFFWKNIREVTDNWDVLTINLVDHVLGAPAVSQPDQEGDQNSWKHRDVSSPGAKHKLRRRARGKQTVHMKQGSSGLSYDDEKYIRSREERLNKTMERKMIIRLIRSMTGKSHRYPALREDRNYEILSVGVSNFVKPE